MKLLLRYTAIIALCLLSFSCEDYLTRSPLDQPSDENFLKNETELKLAVTGVYNILWFDPPGTGSPYKLTFEAVSDNG